MVQYTKFTYKYQGKTFTYYDNDEYLQYNERQHCYRCRVPVTIQENNSTIFILFKLDEDEIGQFHNMVEQGIQDKVNEKN